MPSGARTECDIIPASDYPPVVRGGDHADFLRMLKSPQTTARLTGVVAARRYELCDVVRCAAERLETAAGKGDMTAVFAEAHEIRGLADLGGLAASGSIAGGLCFYLDGAARSGNRVDAGIVSLHADAILRAANARDEATRLGGAVAEQLQALVAHKLGAGAPRDLG